MTLHTGCQGYTGEIRSGQMRRHHSRQKKNDDRGEEGSERNGIPFTHTQRRLSSGNGIVWCKPAAPVVFQKRVRRGRRGLAVQQPRLGREAFMPARPVSQQHRQWPLSSLEGDEPYQFVLFTSTVYRRLLGLAASRCSQQHVQAYCWWSWRL